MFEESPAPSRRRLLKAAGATTMLGLARNAAANPVKARSTNGWAGKAPTHPALTHPTPPKTGAALNQWNIGVNIDAVSYAPNPFTNLLHSASGGFGNLAELERGKNQGEDGPQAPSTDAQGWPTTASYIVLSDAGNASPNTEWATGTWRFRAVTQGKVVCNLPVENERVTGAGDARVVTFDVPMRRVEVVVLKFSAGVRDVEFIHPDYRPNDPSRPIFHAAAAAYYERFSSLRTLGLMDENDTKDHPSHASFAARQKPGKAWGRKSFEFMCAIFSELYQRPKSKVKGIHFIVPYRYSEADTLTLGRLLKQHLPRGAIKFPEKDNEKWNSAYLGAWTYYTTLCENKAAPEYKIINTPAATTAYAGGVNPGHWDRLGRLWALLEARCARAMKAAFPGEFGVTLFPVVAGQATRLSWEIDHKFPWLSLPAQVAEFGTIGSCFGSLMVAPYLSTNKQALAKDAARLLEDLRNDVADDGHGSASPSLRSYIQGFLGLRHTSFAGMRSLASQHGIQRLDAYEWQFHQHDVPMALNLLVQQGETHRAAIKQLMIDQVHAMADAGFSTMHFLSGSPMEPAGNNNHVQWPLATGFSRPPTPKYEAVLALIAESGQ